MIPGLLTYLIKDFVVPELLDIVRRRIAAGQTITDADIIAELDERKLAVVAAGLAWLQEHPAP